MKRKAEEEGKDDMERWKRNVGGEISRVMGRGRQIKMRDEVVVMKRRKGQRRGDMEREEEKKVNDEQEGDKIQMERRMGRREVEI